MPGGGTRGECPAGLPHALALGRTLSAAAFPPRACPRLPSEPPQECGNLTRAGIAVPARGRGHLSTLHRLGGPVGGWQPPSPARDGADTAVVWAQCRPCPSAGLAPPDPQNREGGTGSMQAGCAPGNLDSGGMGTGGGTSSWPCPFTHKCNAFAPNGHTRVHSHTCSPRHRHTSSVCVHTFPRARWAPVGAAPPPTLPHPRSHTPAMGAGSPSLPGPPRSPAAAVPVYGDGAACPALPAPGGLPGHRWCCCLSRAWHRC